MMLRRRLPHMRRGPVLVLLMLAVLLVVPPLTTGTVTSYTFTAVLQDFVVTMPLAIAVGLVMLAGEFDISSVATAALGAMIAVKLGNHNLVLGAVAAGAAGTAAGAFQGTIVAKLGISSVPVTLGGYLFLSGLTDAVGHHQDAVLTSLSVPNFLTGNILAIVPVGAGIALVGALACDVLLRITRLGTSVRAVGGDRRASAVVGLRVDATLICVFAAAGLVASLGGVLNGYSSGSAQSSVSFAPLVTAVTGAVIGGAGAPGAGSIFGIICGVLALSLLQETLAVIGANPDVVNLINAGFLASVALLSAPVTARLISRRSALFSLHRIGSVD